MNPTEDEAGRPEQSAAAQAAARLYEAVGGPVLRTLTGRFRLSPDEAEALLSMVCVFAVEQDVRYRESWAVVSACNDAQALRRRLDQGKAAPPPDITVEEIEALREVVLVGKALNTIPKKGREALRLRFREQRSYAGIAAELDITQQYAKHLVFKSLQRLRAVQRAEDEEQDG
jgi:DNA-directed RNA polymerase specialized sigma24 family protein